MTGCIDKYLKKIDSVIGKGPFKAEKFNPDEWISLFKEAGARYVIPVAEHHDGFQMYRSRISHWNAFETGPHKDILKELCVRAKREGLVF